MNLLISAKDLACQRQSDWVLIDTRHELMDHEAGERAYQQGHIPGAIFLHGERDLCGEKTGKNGRHPLPDPQVFIERLIRLGVKKDSPIVVYDSKISMFAARAWWMLRWVGCTQVCILDGGFDAWLKEGGEIEIGRPDKTQNSEVKGCACEQRLPVNEEQLNEWQFPDSGVKWTVTVQDILDNLTHPQWTVVDARAENRFRGEDETIDPVGGHIPGALNYPFMQNLDDQGKFKSTQTLKTQWQTFLNGRKPEKIIHQCGSGITACHNLFAMELAGLTGSCLYPGSWSEWCAEASRPIAVGVEIEHF